MELQEIIDILNNNRDLWAMKYLIDNSYEEMSEDYDIVIKDPEKIKSITKKGKEVLGCVKGFGSKGWIQIQTKRMDTYEDLNVFDISDLVSNERDIWSLLINSIRSYTPMQITIDGQTIEINFPTEEILFKGKLNSIIDLVTMETKKVM